MRFDLVGWTNRAGFFMKKHGPESWYLAVRWHACRRCNGLRGDDASAGSK